MKMANEMLAEQWVDRPKFRSPTTNHCMAYRLATPAVCASFQFDPYPIYDGASGELSINRAVRTMTNGDICQFLVYRIQLDPTHHAVNKHIATTAEVLKVNQLHIAAPATQHLKIRTLRDKDRKYVLKCCGGFFCSPVCPRRLTPSSARWSTGSSRSTPPTRPSSTT